MSTHLILWITTLFLSILSCTFPISPSSASNEIFTFLQPPTEPPPGAPPEELLPDTAEPSDLDDDRFPLNIEQIAMELTSLTPEEIRYYPLTDLTPEEIELVLEHLTPNNLAKVLLNIPQESLLEIQDILSPLTIDKTLDRISEPNRTQIENRFLVSSPP